MSVFNTFNFIASHPLTRDHRAQAMLRWLRWQVGSRLLGCPVSVLFVNDARLLIAAGMSGATGNVYCGLHEFEDMAFLLHFLRPGDLFFDIGANVGSYTVLASAVCGADTVAVEPDPHAFRILGENVRLNSIDARVEACNLALGRVAGRARFSRRWDTGNHMAAPGEAAAPGDFTEVDVRTAVQLLGDRVPVLVKMDIEGYELEVIQGSAQLFSNTALLAVIVELNGSGQRYGHGDDVLDECLRGHGFTAWRYAPLQRTLLPAPEKRGSAGNVLYLRNQARALERVSSAKPFRVLGREI